MKRREKGRKGEKERKRGRKNNFGRNWRWAKGNGIPTWDGEGGISEEETHRLLREL